MSEAEQPIPAGDGDASVSPEVLLPAVYAELRRLAAHRMAQEAPGQTLQPTALVHEAWLRLTGNENVKWDGRAHFSPGRTRALFSANNVSLPSPVCTRRMPSSLLQASATLSCPVLSVSVTR